MSEAKAKNTGGLFGIGTDERVLGLAGGQWFRVPEHDSNLDDAKENQPTDWIEKSFSFTTGALESTIDPSSCELHWEATFEHLAFVTSPKIRKAENAHMYSGAIARDEVERAIDMRYFDYNVRDVIGCEFCIASSDGQQVYNIIKDNLRKDIGVRISFDEITLVSYAFLNSAIGQLHNGEFLEDKIKEKLIITGMSPDYEFLLNRIVIRAKKYYENPELFEVGSGDAYAD